MSGPVGINLELTSRCPFRCPQCYAASGGPVRELPFPEGVERVREAASLGIRFVNLSGGEPLLYPDLEQLIRVCRDLGLDTAVSLSGAGADRRRIRALIEAGVSKICVSLNGSTEAINALSREGYAEAIRTLALLQEAGGCMRVVNWVMHAGNAADLPELLKLCGQYGVHALSVLQNRRAAAGGFPDSPDLRQIRKTALFLRLYRGPVAVVTDGCFLELRSRLPYEERYNAEGDCTGCSAGLTHLAVNTEGLLMPCRHLNLPERFASIREYLSGSAVLKMLRERIRQNPAWRPCDEIPEGWAAAKKNY